MPVATPPVFDVAIAGRGPAGITAAIYCARSKLSTVMFGEIVGGQAAVSADIENYPGFTKITGKDLSTRLAEHVNHYPEIVQKPCNVVKVEKKPDGFRLKTSDGAEYRATSVIIATGAKPRKLNIPGEAAYEYKGLSYCAACDGPAYGGKDVAVIGGGNSALDAAALMAQIARTVYLITINPEFTGDQYLFQTVRNYPNVKILYNTQTTQVLGDSMLSGINVKTPEGEKTLRVRGVFVEIGRIPVTEMVDVEKTAWGEIITSRDAETPIEGLFAAGDCTDVHEKQIAVAVGMGCAAAMYAFKYVSHKNSSKIVA